MTADTLAMRAQGQSALDSLSPPALKAALRLAQLPDWRAYSFTLLKLGSQWVLVLEDAGGRKAEVCR